MIDGIEAKMARFGLRRGRTKQMIARNNKNKGIGAGGSKEHDYQANKTSSLKQYLWEGMGG
jgi:hypothetical protein